jgi:uncharacterized membrane protein YfcA
MFPFSDKVYQWLKWLAAIVFPALAALVGAVGIALNLPHVDIAVTIIVAIGAFIGALVGASTSAYNRAKDGETK